MFATHEADQHLRLDALQLLVESRFAGALRQTFDVFFAAVGPESIGEHAPGVFGTALAHVQRAVGGVLKFFEDGLGLFEWNRREVGDSVANQLHLIVAEMPQQCRGRFIAQRHQ